jgi:hypothetical protein
VKVYKSYLVTINRMTGHCWFCVASLRSVATGYYYSVSACSLSEAKSMLRRAKRAGYHINRGTP